MTKEGYARFRVKPGMTQEGYARFRVKPGMTKVCKPGMTHKKGSVVDRAFLRRLTSC